MKNNMNSSSSSSSSSLGTSDEGANIEIESIRDVILKCPSLSHDNYAIQLALSALDTIQREKQQSKDAYNFQSHHNNTPNANKVNNDTSSRKTKSTTNKASSSSSYSIISSLLQFTIIYIPIITLFLFLGLMTSLQHIHDTYWEPQYKLMEYTDQRRAQDITYYHRHCTTKDISTKNAHDLLISTNDSTLQNIHHIQTHGMSIYPQILTPDTATTLRNYILQRNSQLTDNEKIDVISNTQRWSFGIGANDDPIISKALKDIATNDVLKLVLEGVLGRNPAIIEMTAITSAYGAEDQFWHADVVHSGSSLKYARSFVPSYSLFIALQDVTAEMGATAVCPGTHVCTNDYPEYLCSTPGFQVSGNNNIWPIGSAILMNQQSFHRGAAHIDPNGPHRVLFILTFAPRPLWNPYYGGGGGGGGGETRMLGQGGSYSTRWDMWGHTLNDLVDAPRLMKQPWAALRSLGVYKPKDADWGWDWPSIVFMRIANKDTGYSDDDFLNLKDDEQQGSRVFGVLSFFLTTNGLENWRDYLNHNIRNLVRIGWVVNVSMWSLYLFSSLLFIAIHSTLISKRQKKSVLDTARPVLQSIARLVLILITISALIRYSWHRLSFSKWAQEIKTGTLYSSPFPLISSSSTIKSSLTHPVTVVDVADVLIGKRYNSDFLSSLNNFLKYHPGNAKFESLLDLYSKHLSFADEHKISQMIVDEITQGGGFFLIQDELGDWCVLNANEAHNYSRGKLLLRRNLVFDILEDTAMNLMSPYDRRGANPQSAMRVKYNGLLINGLLNKVYSLHGFSYKDLFRLWGFNQEQSVVKENRSKEKPDNYSFVLKNEIISKPKIRVINHDLITSRVSSLPNMNSVHDDDDDLRYLTIGDEIEAKYPESIEWYKGVVTNIWQGYYIDVKYDDGEELFSLSPDEVEFFEPYKEDENLEARKSMDGPWQQATVRRLAGNKVVIKFSDGKVMHVPYGYVRRMRTR